MEMTKFVSKMGLYIIFILQTIKNFSNNLHSPVKKKTPHLIYIVQQINYR